MPKENTTTGYSVKTVITIKEIFPTKEKSSSSSTTTSVAEKRSKQMHFAIS